MISIMRACRRLSTIEPQTPPMRAKSVPHPLGRASVREAKEDVNQQLSRDRRQRALQAKHGTIYAAALDHKAPCFSSGRQLVASPAIPPTPLVPSPLYPQSSSLAAKA